MAAIYVRSVPESTVAILKVRAARAGQSLPAYVRQLLDSEAGTLTAEEAAEQARTIAARSSVTADDVTDTISATRQACP